MTDSPTPPGTDHRPPHTRRMTSGTAFCPGHAARSTRGSA
jgi:hypothetical protein